MYAESTYGIIYNIVLDTDLAEEILHDVYIKIWKKPNPTHLPQAGFSTGIKYCQKCIH